jgi:hypothetical protein
MCPNSSYIAVDVHAGFDCAVCEVLISGVETYLAGGESEQQIEQQLENYCAKLPDFNTDCDNLIVEYVPQAINWIQGNENPDTFCTQMGLC